MFPSVLLSSLAAGIIATAVMLAVLYLPRTWGGPNFDVLRALGSAFTGRLDARTLALGTLLYFLGGVIFAIFYGWLAAQLVAATEAVWVPQIIVVPAPMEINLFYPILGMMIGLAHGGIVSLFTAILVIEHHPIERFRTYYGLVPSQILGHVVYGATVMLLHHQFLRMLVGA